MLNVPDFHCSMCESLNKLNENIRELTENSVKCWKWLDLENVSRPRNWGCERIDSDYHGIQAFPCFDTEAWHLYHTTHINRWFCCVIPSQFAEAQTKILIFLIFRALPYQNEQITINIFKWIPFPAICIWRPRIFCRFRSFFWWPETANNGRVSTAIECRWNYVQCLRIEWKRWP